MKLFNVLIGLILVSSLACALHDSCISIDEDIDSVCLCADSLSNCAGSGESICLDGTDDHFIYFIPCNSVPDPDNYTGVLNYAVDKSGEGIQGMYVLILMIIVCVGGVIIVKRLAFSN